MKLNIFRIPIGNYEELLNKLADKGLALQREVQQDDWLGKFFFSADARPEEIKWLSPYRSFFLDGLPTNMYHCGAFVFLNGTSSYAVSYGKTHFYLRPFCDLDFGTELAKRIADVNEVKQTSSRRFHGVRKKEIRSFIASTPLDVDSGASVDFVQAQIAKVHENDFGKSGKFGSSALLTVDLEISQLGAVFDRINNELASSARFKLPRTEVVSDEELVKRFDDRLVRELVSEDPAAEFSHNSYDLYGVDFIFSNDAKFVLRSNGSKESHSPSLELADLRSYIKSNKILRDEILNIRVSYQREGAAPYSKTLKQSLDFIIDDDNVILDNGRWVRFNEDYLERLDDYLREIRMETPEHELAEIEMTEPEFFDKKTKYRELLNKYDYEVFDQNFSIAKTRVRTSTEAWDLRKHDCVYAVKFGPAQKLGYVCDQAMSLLEIYRNRASENQIPKFKQYCLWFGYEAKSHLSSIADSGSIILKQKIEAWARGCRNLNIEPVIKISRKKPKKK